jgi:PAS domain S-box-containing protein
MGSEQDGTVTTRDPVLDAAPDAVITIDGSGAILEFNTAAERIFGLTRAEALGRSAFELLAPECQRPAHEAGLRRAVAGGEWILGRRLALPAHRSDGREIVVEVFLTRTNDAPPRFTAWIREQSGIEPGEEHTSVGSWTWTPSECDLRWSDSVYRILGLRPGDVVPDPKVIVDLTHPDDREHVRSKQQDVKVAGEHPPVAYRIVRPDGEVRHLRTVSAVAERRDGVPHRLVGFVEDVTDRINARRGIDAQMALAQAIATWTSFEQAAQRVLSGLATALEYQYGIVWLPLDHELLARTVWPDETSDPRVLDTVQRGVRLRRGSCPAWRAQAQRKVSHAPGVVAIPAVSGTEVLAVVELRSAERLERSDALMRSLGTVGHKLGAFLAQHRDELAIPLLTPRELEVLALATRGLAAKEIARQLAIGGATVRTHFENIYPKLGVSDRAAAVAAAMRLGLIS